MKVIFSLKRLNLLSLKRSEKNKNKRMSAIIKLGDFIPYYDEASRVYPTESVKFQPKTASSGLENEQPVSLMETVFESFLGPRVKPDSQPVITNAEWSWSLLSTQEQKSVDLQAIEREIHLYTLQICQTIFLSSFAFFMFAFFVSDMYK